MPSSRSKAQVGTGRRLSGRLSYAWDLCIACSGPFAGKPAPTGGACNSRDVRCTCRSGLARERAGAGDPRSIRPASRRCTPGLPGTACTGIAALGAPACAAAR
ncbi:hypothetical protein F7661_11235 [Pseudomonas sp. CFA]|nr:hypothetical protein F7661_11235 [Pseudomonas sp. CFA]